MFSIILKSHVNTINKHFKFGISVSVANRISVTSQISVKICFENIGINLNKMISVGPWYR